MSDETARDDDNPIWTPDDFARAEPAEALPPHILAAFPLTVERVSGAPMVADKEGVLIAFRNQNSGALLIAITA